MSAFNSKKHACYAALLLLCGSVAAQARTTLHVHCGASTGLTTIGAALKVLKDSEDGGPSTINVSGACHENVNIENFDHLTLRAVNGASITDASSNTMDTIIIGHSQGIVVQGFSVTGGVDAFDVFQSTARLIQNTVQGALYDGVGVYRGGNAEILDGTMQNNGYAGLLVWGGDAVAAGVTLQGNYEGIAIDDGGRVLFAVSDPFYAGVPGVPAAPAVIANNLDFGIVAQRNSEVRCASCSITGNTTAGVYLEFGSTARFTAYYSASVPNAPPTSITSNHGAGVSVGVLSSATFRPRTSVSGNGSQYNITCNTATSVTRGAHAAAAGSTNCTDQ